MLVTEFWYFQVEQLLLLLPLLSSLTTSFGFKSSEWFIFYLIFFTMILLSPRLVISITIHLSFIQHNHLWIRMPGEESSVDHYIPLDFAILIFGDTSWDFFMTRFSLCMLWFPQSPQCIIFATLPRCLLFSHCDNIRHLLTLCYTVSLLSPHMLHLSLSIVFSILLLI